MTVVLLVAAVIALLVFVGALGGLRLQRRAIAHTYKREIDLTGAKPKGGSFSGNH